MVLKLLAKDPKRRLGANGASEVKEHKFFNGVNWDLVLKKELTPPFVPSVKGKEDTSYFINVTKSLFLSLNPYRLMK